MSSTVGGQTRANGLGIRWIFPDFAAGVTPLTDGPLILGRDPDCDVSLLGTEASRHHAEIRRDGPLWVIRDLGSTNGVFQNGRRVQEAPLSERDLVRVGEWIGMVIRCVDAEPGGEAFGSPARSLFVGPVLSPLLEPVERVAASDLPIIVEGETGTGKERVALAIHEWSGRTGPFVAVNCAGLPAPLVEAELFGYRKGAFTGADRQSPGYFRAADGGTLLLDEVVDLPLGLQPKLLRVLEQKEVVPLGESQPTAIDVRIVAASQEPLAHAVEGQRFRPDLFARLDGLRVRLPPLRERVAEIPYLFTHLLRQHAGGRPPAVSSRLIERLCVYDLPFNVRELDMLARRLLILHGHEPLLRRSQLPPRVSADHPASSAGVAPVRSSQPSARGEGASVSTTEDRTQRQLAALVDALRTHGGVVARAAAAVGISRQRAYRLMETHGGIDLQALRATPASDASREGTT